MFCVVGPGGREVGTYVPRMMLVGDPTRSPVLAVLAAMNWVTRSGTASLMLLQSPTCMMIGVMEIMTMSLLVK